MSLEYQNPNNTVNQINPFQQHPFAFENPNHILLPSNETDEFLSYDSLQFYDPPPFDDFIEDPPFEEDYSAQFLSFPKRQRHENYNGDFMMNDQSIPNPNYYDYYNNNCNNCNNNNVDYGETNNENIKVKGKEISVQSKAARERRRKITEKTGALSKMIPGAGGNRMNTAQMFQAAFKYVKFMHAQLRILQSINTLQQDNSEKEGMKNNLSILSSQLIQEKLYAKEKCLVPIDFLPILEQHCDSEMKPLISQHMKDLLH